MRLTPITSFLFLAAYLQGFSAVASTLGLPERQFDQSPEVVTLGKKLFFDRRLSINKTLSCAMCHIPEQGFAQNQLATPVGIEGKVLKRNSPTLLNIGYLDVLFHDGREFTLETQVWSPLLDKREMGNPSVGMVIETIRRLDDYEVEFERLLGGIDPITIGIALASYQRTLNAADSPFDRWFYGGDTQAVSQDVIDGFAIFNRHGCATCHSVDEKSALFTDQLFHNTGIGHERTMAPKTGTKVVRLTDTVMIKTKEEFEGEVFNDLGRYEVTEKSEDRWKYRTPSLRNIELTAPYMHDGSMKDLETVIRYYMAGGFEKPDPDQDPRIMQFILNPHEVGQLVAFLKSLTSSHIADRVSEARQVPVGD